MSYEPSPRQVEFRDLARSLMDNTEQPMRFAAQWCKVTRSSWEAPVAMAEFKRWEKADGFKEWWAALFPETERVSITDLRMMEFANWENLDKAIRMGDVNAMKLFAKISAIAQVVDEVRGSSLDEETEAWVGGFPEMAWGVQPVGEAK